MRFADIAVGDQLVLRSVRYIETPFEIGHAYDEDDFLSLEAHHRSHYAVVIDIRHEHRDLAQRDSSEAIVLVRLLQNGIEVGEPQAFSPSALANGSWEYADRDEIGYWANVMQAVHEGKLIGIGKGKRHGRS